MVSGSPLANVLARLQGVKKNGDGFMAKCPAHADARASLKLSEGTDGRVLVHCHAGCSFDAIVAGLGMSAGDLFPEKAAPLPFVHRAPAIQHDYTDENSRLLYQVVRSADKQFRQRRPDGKGGWSWTLEGVRRVPYRLPELLEAAALEKTIFIVEGEKDVESLRALGIVATTNSGGAGKWDASFAEHFAGASRVIVLPDNDAPGERHADDVAKSLVGRVPDVRILKLPGLKPKGDVSDWLQAGGTGDELYRLADLAPRYGVDVVAVDMPEAPGIMTRKLYTLRELYDRPELLKQPADILPYGLARAGRATLLSSLPKCGKTTMMAQAVAERSRGGMFLDHQLAHGHTLWYQLDEGLSDSVIRFQRLKADPDHISITQDRPSALDMRADIEATGATVVMVDTLPELWRGVVKSANDSEEIGVFVRPYIEVARETGAAICFLYHTSKSGVEYRGGVQLAASVDIPLTLRRPAVSLDIQPGADWDEEAADDGRRLLRGTGRGVKVDLRLSFDGARYTLGSQPMPLGMRILRELNRDPASGSALAEMLGKQKQQVLAEIRSLVDAEKVRRDGRTFDITPIGRATVAADASGSTPVPSTLTGYGRGSAQ